MKLAFIINNKKAIGGGEYAQFMFALHLAKKGHEVVVFAGNKNFLYQKFKKQKNLTVKYKPNIPTPVKKVGFGQLNKLWSKIYESFFIKPYLKTFIPDWIVGYLRESAIQAAKLGKQHGFRVVNFIFESPPWMKEQLGKTWDYELENKTLRKSWEKTKIAYENSDLLVPNSKLSGKKCKEWLPTAKVTMPVYPGIDLEKTRKSNVKSYDIIFISRLNELKNPQELLKAVSPEQKLVFIGDGEERNKLEELAKKRKLNVMFTGSIPDDEKWYLLSKSRLLVFPTSFEGFGMPPMEALASGLQVLCSDIPILKEVYNDKVHYFKLHDIKDMSRKINDLLSIKSQQKVPTKFLERFRWENSAKTIEKILK